MDRAVAISPGLALAPLLSGLLIASCAASADESSWTSQTDTLPNGVIHVVNVPGAEGPAPTVAAREEIRIGKRAIGGPESFGLIRQVAALPDGRIAVLDAMAEELRIFSPGGEHERTFGGSGGGPGELRGAQGVLLGPDALLRVPEQGNARMSFFDPDSGFIGSRRLPLYAHSTRGPWRAAIDSSGRTLVWSSGRYRGGAWLMIRVYDEAMAQVDSIPYHDYTNGSRDEPGVWPVTFPNGMRSGIPVPFHPREDQVLDPSGEIWSTAGGRSTLRVERWRPAGDTSIVIESRRRPPPVTPAERDSVVTALEERFPAGAGQPRLDYGEIPDRKPPAYDLSLDDRGRLWVRLTSPDHDTTAYDVFGSDGRHAETVLLHASVDPDIPPLVRGDVLWAIIRDEVDVQYVIRARLHRLN